MNGRLAVEEKKEELLGVETAVYIVLLSSAGIMVHGKSETINASTSWIWTLRALRFLRT